MSSMHDIRDYKMKDYVKILLIVLVLSGFINIVAAAPSLPLNIQKFNYQVWGSYYTVTYDDKSYFAGYVGGGQIADRDIFTYNYGQLHTILMNDDIQQNLTMGDSMQLGEGYQFKIKDISNSSMEALVSLLKDGGEVDSDVINIGGTYIYKKKLGNVSDLPMIAIHLNSVFISNVSKTVFIKGIFEISETFITVTPPSDISMNIISWGNNETNDNSLSLSIVQGTTVRFNVTTNLDFSSVYNGCGNGIRLGAESPTKSSTYVDCKFNVTGITSSYINPRNTSTSTEVIKTWTVTILPENPPISTTTPTPTITQTLTPTPTITQTLTPTPTPTITSTQIVTPTPTPTSTIQIPDINKRAQLQVTYEVGSLINDRITIKVFLKNVGDATASNINLTIEHSHELEPIAASGSKQIGDTISWTGDLLPNAEHITEYSVKAIKGKDVEIPLKVTYAKISREEKAKALGVSSSASISSITQEDIDTIIMIIKILKSIPGFELIMAISILFLVHVFLKNRIRR